MAYFRQCPYCGANLDPGERCDCREDKPDGGKEERNAEAHGKGGGGHVAVLVGDGSGGNSRGTGWNRARAAGV